MNNYITGYINGEYKLELTTHAKERAIERFKSLGIKLNDEEYIELAQAGISESLTNKFMYRYMDNVMKHKNHDVDVLVYDTNNKMVYALVLKPQKDSIVLKTLGTSHDGSKWEYYNKKYQRICWIHKDAFVFSTLNGNVTWI